MRLREMGAWARRKPTPPPLTIARILTLAARPEGFRVTGRWRDQTARNRCAKLARDGLLYRDRSARDAAYTYRITPAGRAALEGHDER